MADFLEVYKKQEAVEVSEIKNDAEAIKDTPYQGALPSGVSGPDFSHENAAAWKLLKEELSEEDYKSLREAVVAKVGEFKEVEPEMDDES